MMLYQKQEGSKNTELPVEESDESDEVYSNGNNIIFFIIVNQYEVYLKYMIYILQDNVPILKRKLYTEMKKSKRNSQQSQKKKRKLSDADKAKQGHTGKKKKIEKDLKKSEEKPNTTKKSKVQKELKRSVESKKV